MPLAIAPYACIEAVGDGVHPSGEGRWPKSRGTQDSAYGKNFPGSHFLQEYRSCPGYRGRIY